PPAPYRASQVSRQYKSRRATGVTPCQTYASEKSLPGCWVTRPSSSSSSSNLSTVWALSPEDSMIESTWSLSESFRLFKIAVVLSTGPSAVLASSDAWNNDATSAFALVLDVGGVGTGAAEALGNRLSAAGGLPTI